MSSIGTAQTIRRTKTVSIATVAPGADQETKKRVVEFFTARIRNPHTRRAYLSASQQFAAWCAQRGLRLEALQPTLVALYIEELSQAHKPATVKQRLAALRMLLDHLVVTGVLTLNPARSVAAPKESVRRGKTPVLHSEELTTLFASIPTDTVVGLRDRALLGVMLFSFARVGALVKMDVRHYRTQGRRAFFELSEKGGKWTRVPVHHQAAAWMDAYLEAASLREDIAKVAPKSPLWRTTRGRSGALSARRMASRDVLAMVKRRCAIVGLPDDVCSHSFRAAGITAFLKNGGSLETAARIAGHASTQTTQLYDRRTEDIALSDIERIRI